MVEPSAQMYWASILLRVVEMWLSHKPPIDFLMIAEHYKKLESDMNSVVTGPLLLYATSLFLGIPNKEYP